LISAAITALSSEAVGIRLGGGCERGDFNGCWIEVTILLPSVRAMQGLLAVDLGIVVVVAVLLNNIK